MASVYEPFISSTDSRSPPATEGSAPPLTWKWETSSHSLKNAPHPPQRSVLSPNLSKQKRLGEAAAWFIKCHLEHFFIGHRFRPRRPWGSRAQKTPEGDGRSPSCPLLASWSRLVLPQATPAAVRGLAATGISRKLGRVRPCGLLALPSYLPVPGPSVKALRDPCGNPEAGTDRENRFTYAANQPEFCVNCEAT